MAKTFKDNRRSTGLFALPASAKRKSREEDPRQQRRAKHERKELLRRMALEDLLSGG